MAVKLPVPTEHQEQVALVRRCRAAVGRYRLARTLLAIPNGGKRDRIAGARLKAEGVVPGIPDLLLPVPIETPGGTAVPGLWIELKRRRGGRVSEDQHAAHRWLRSLGWVVEVCRGHHEAWEAITRYLDHAMSTPEAPL